MKVLANRKKVKIEYEKKSAQIEIMANKDDIEKLLLNLIRNAIKYNKENGWIKVWVEKEKEGVIINIEDGGIGIPEKELSRIFERFYRVDKARTRSGEDSGLGLAICKHIVESYGGRIDVKSTFGEGTIFYFHLPNNLN